MEANDSISEKGKKIWAVKQEMESRKRQIPGPLLLTVYLGGRLQYHLNSVEYMGGSIYMIEGFEITDTKVYTLRDLVREAQRSLGCEEHDNFSMWYGIRKKVLNSANSCKKIESVADVQGFYLSKEDNRLLLYVIGALNQKNGPQHHGPQYHGPQFKAGQTSQPKTVIWHMSKHNTQPFLASSVSIPKPLPKYHSQPTQSNPPKQPLPFKRGPKQLSTQNFSAASTQNSKNRKFSSPLRKSPRLHEVIFLGSSDHETGSSNPISDLPSSSAPQRNPPSPPLEHLPPPTAFKRTTPRVKHVAKKKVVSKNESEVGGEKEKGKKKSVRRLFDEEDDVVLNEESESDSDLSDFDYEPVEEDIRKEDDVSNELQFASKKNGGEDLVAEILKDYPPRNQSQSKGSETGSQPRWEEAHFVAKNTTEPVFDSDDEGSVHDSEDEGDADSTFNPYSDLKGEVKLVLGLKFNSIYELRKAVQHHSIQKKYAYYFLHNGSERFEVYCRFKCDCYWNPKKGKIMYCKCEREDLKCWFKIKAVQISEGGMYQIRDLDLHHDCGQYHSNNKLTSEYLAERYLEDWKSDPNWKLVAFIEKVGRDVGIKISYQKAWLTRCRVKQILFGDASEQYAKVYQYAFAFLKYNPQSTAVVKVETTDGASRPNFMRMYICLEACKTGYKQGCRPIIGLDGCHLKGPYPGMILAAIAKDGNNCIFPVAWAIVEVENTSTWTWFIELLLNDIGHLEGNGLTLMSDRQKGLIEAISLCAPEAGVRYCVRHIWANFKKKFSGTIFKEHVWKAAKATTKQDFVNELECIRFISEDAYKWLKDINPKHWSRHAFSITAKSNMVTNNMCETFNAVIKEARDKPVLTCLEWIRRYVMRRHNEKWDEVHKQSGKFMPYVGRVFGWISEGAKHCYPIHSRTDEWEVDTVDDRLIVNLQARTCTCNHFMLTGIPCAHAWSCIMAKRGKPEDYVDDCYSKDMVKKAYSSHIKPMPGFKHWEPCTMPEPLPPPFKIMPGRPSLKHRRKEAGEEEEGKKRKFKKVAGQQQRCSNCQQLGHKKLHCKNPAAAPPPKPEPKKGGRPPSNDPWVVKSRNERQARAQKLKHNPPSDQNVEHGPTHSTVECSSSKATAPKQKLPVKCSKKKQKSLKDDILFD